MNGKDDTQYADIESESWDCVRCAVGFDQPLQPYGRHMCRYCGQDSTPQYLYVMRMVDQPYYKIGISSDLRGRQLQLQTASPFDIELLCFYNARDFDAQPEELERMVHQMLRRFHLRREWYSPDEAVVATLTSLNKLFEAVWHYAAFGQVL